MSRGEFVMSGYLTKSPPESKIKVAQWHKRWFLLMDSSLVYPLADRYVRLEYYQSQIEAKRLADPKGIINLRSCTEVKERDQIKGYKFVFDICTEDRVYHLASETEEERQEWIMTLNNLLFGEPQRQNNGGRRHSPPQSRSDVLRRIKGSPVRQQRPLSFTGSPTNSMNRNSEITSRPLPSLPVKQLADALRKSRPLPPPPVDEDQSLPGVHIHHIGPKKSPQVARTKKKKDPPPRPVPFHLSHPSSSPTIPTRSISQPATVNEQATVNDHYEVGPGQVILISQTKAEKKSPQIGRRVIPTSKSLEEPSVTSNGGILQGGDDDYSLLQVEPADFNPNSEDYSHLGPINDRGSPPPPPPPIRHSSKQNSNTSYQNMAFIPTVHESDYSHLKYT